MRYSLATKLFWNTLLVLVMTLGATSWYSITEERASISLTLQKYGKSIATTLAAFSVEALIARDYPALENTLQTVGGNSENVLNLQVTHESKVVAKYGVYAEGLEFSAPITIYQDGFPLRQIGEVRVVLSQNDFENVISARIRELAWNSVVLFITLALALNVLTRRLVLSKIERLSAATEGVITDETLVPLNKKNDIESGIGDELDHLHARYTAMLNGLRLREQQRNNAIREVHETQALLDDVANSLPSALIVVSSSGAVEYRNRSAIEFALNQHESDEQKELANFFPQFDRSLLANLNSAVKDGQEFSLNRAIWRVNGKQRIVDIAVFPLLSRKAGGVVVRIDDVTNRSRFEEAMIQSEKMISVGGLAAGVAHEINNPLGVMIQAAQNIERRVSEDVTANHRSAKEVGVELSKVREYMKNRNILEFIDDIKSDGARAAKIVRSLLEFSRKSEPVFVDTDLSVLINHAIDLARKDYDLKKRFDFRRVNVIFNVAENLALVPVIQSELEQVILNLLKNSAQAMIEKFSNPDEPSSPTITINAALVGEYVEIEIKDNGPGFTEESRRRAFEPFFTSKAPGEGTGLGLWISYMIITEKHHGELQLDSHPGEGASFLIRLPLAR